MHTKINLAWAEASLSRILEVFEQEIMESSEEEIMEAAKELGMKPDMKEFRCIHRFEICFRHSRRRYLRDAFLVKRTPREDDL
jgi:hypothetical protein